MLHTVTTHQHSPAQPAAQRFRRLPPIQTTHPPIIKTGFHRCRLQTRHTIHTATVCYLASLSQSRQHESLTYSYMFKPLLVDCAHPRTRRQIHRRRRENRRRLGAGNTPSGDALRHKPRAKECERPPCRGAIRTDARKAAPLQPTYASMMQPPVVEKERKSCTNSKVSKAILRTQ